MKRVNTYIGAPVERVEDFRFVTGRGTYVGDLERPGQWHMVVMRSQIAHGLIKSIAATQALALPGVHAVLTAHDIGDPVPMIPFRRPIPSILPYGQPVIASRKVRYVGEPVAVVLADSAEIAEDALALIDVDIEPLPAVVEAREAFAGGVRLFEDAPDGNITATFFGGDGDVEAALASAHLRLKHAFRTQRQTALPMETRGLLAEWDEAAGKLVMSGAAKLPFFNRRAMAKVMGLEETQVEYVEYDVGGGFGARGEFYPEDALTAICARKFKRPVRWIEDRREHFMATGHSREADADVELGFDRDGRIVACRAEIFCNIGAYMRPNGTTPVRNVAQFLSGPYLTGTFDVKSYAVASNKTPSGTYRGPGRFESCFFFERMLDMAARKLGIDRVEIRRRNLITHAQMPFKMVKIGPVEGWDDTYLDSGDYVQGLDAALKEARWADKASLSGKLVDGRYHGLGIACFVEGGASGPREHARMTLLEDGNISLAVGSSSIGQGIETIFAQIAADALEIEIDRITVLHGSTTLLNECFGSFGSLATVMGGCAVIDAARNLIAAFAEAAARRLGVAATDLQISEGVAKAADGRSAALSDFAGEELAADGVFHNNKPTFTYGAGVAHVAVDAGTGGVEVIDYTVVDDVGRIINPVTLHGQVMGAAVQGLGAVFGEDIIYDGEGQILVGTLADYHMPHATDFPHVHCTSTELHPSPNNPLGAKGAGEGGIIPIAGAVVNAVADALSSLGVEPKELPITPPRLWDLIETTRCESASRGA
ncbi:MAG: xanthine dehydrogenase family protein molybdopterin-binding subunit [Hyphomicrobiaceae bacterium]